MINMKRFVIALLLLISFTFANNWDDKTEYHETTKVDRSFVIGVNVPFGVKKSDGLSSQILELNCVNNQDLFLILWNADGSKNVDYNPNETVIIINQNLFLTKDDFVGYDSEENMVGYLVDESYIEYLPQLFKDKVIIATEENGKAERVVYDVSGVEYSGAYRSCIGG